MAPKKRTAKPIQTNQLHELVSIRNTLQLAQQSLTRLEKSVLAQSSPTQPSGTLVTPAKTLRNKLYNADNTTRICWYHKNFGNAANPHNCPGPDSCTFVPTPVMRTNATSTFPTRESRPPQTTALFPPNNMPGPSIARTITPRSTVLATVPVTTSQPTNGSMDWFPPTEDNATQRKLSIELETELLDLSD